MRIIRFRQSSLLSRVIVCLICLIGSMASTASAQMLQVTGIVVDSDDEPLIGATVWEKGSKSNRTITDFNGQFTIKAEAGAKLQVTYVGFKPAEVTAGSSEPLRIVMSSDSQMLSDVVVIGYGTISKKEVTSAVSHVSSKDMLQVGGGNPAMQIQGKVPGLSVESSTAADPNAGVSMQIRGVTSRNAGLGPLVVIDGVPGGSLDNLNENDIESIDVLKDGAASAIYGTRGSNGVVVVTTKKGAKDGAVHTTYSGYVNISDPIRELEVLSADQFRSYKRGDDYGANTDWFKEITKVGVSQSHTLTVSGGNARNNYRATVDYKDTEGIDLRAKRRQVGARFSLNHTGKDDICKITLNVAPRNVKYDNSDYDAFREALMMIESDYAMLRLPEIIYYLAEIRFKQGKKAEAERLLNTVRKRNYPEGSPSLYPEDGSVITEQELLDEWGREFLAEGLRRQTLCRFGVYNTGRWWDKEPDADNHTMWIPLSRTTLNTNPNLKQNPGYPGL